jgi:hypothetical protein
LEGAAFSWAVVGGPCGRPNSFVGIMIIYISIYLYIYILYIYIFYIYIWTHTCQARPSLFEINPQTPCTARQNDQTGRPCPPPAHLGGHGARARAAVPHPLHVAQARARPDLPQVRLFFGGGGGCWISGTLCLGISCLIRTTLLLDNRPSSVHHRQPTPRSPPMALFPSHQPPPPPQRPMAAWGAINSTARCSGPRASSSHQVRVSLRRSNTCVPGWHGTAHKGLGSEWMDRVSDRHR